MDTNSTKDILIKFGETIRHIRKQHGYSQEYFAQLSELDRSYIGSVERGERNISLVNIEKIANALEVSLDLLFKELNG